MAKTIPYLHRRGDTFNFRISVPKELRVYTGCRELTKTLQTTDKQLAVPRVLELAAYAKRLFFDLRYLMSTSNKDDMKIAMKVAAEALKLRWAREEHDAELSKMQETMRAERLLANTKLDAYKEIFDKLNASTTQNIISNSEPLPPKSDTSKVKITHKLSEVIPIWIDTQNPAKSSIVAFTSVVSKFEKLNPTLTVESIKSENVENYIKILKAEQLNPKTISKNISFIRALLNVALSNKWISINPAVGHKLPSKKTKKPPIRGYNIDEINSIFSSPIYSNAYRPSAGKGEAAYWIPLILLFTGARREEIWTSPNNVDIFQCPICCCSN